MLLSLDKNEVDDEEGEMDMSVNDRLNTEEINTTEE